MEDKRKYVVQLLTYSILTDITRIPRGTSSFIADLDLFEVLFQQGIQYAFPDLVQPVVLKQVCFMDYYLNQFRFCMIE